MCIDYTEGLILTGGPEHMRTECKKLLWKIGIPDVSIWFTILVFIHTILFKWAASDPMYTFNSCAFTPSIYLAYISSFKIEPNIGNLRPFSTFVYLLHLLSSLVSVFLKLHFFLDFSFLNWDLYVVFSIHLVFVIINCLLYGFHHFESHPPNHPPRSCYQTLVAMRIIIRRLILIFLQLVLTLNAWQFTGNW